MRARIGIPRRLMTAVAVGAIASNGALAWPSPSNAATVAVPIDGRLVFGATLTSSARDLYSMRPDGTDLKPLTAESSGTNPVVDTDPVWSPDGSRIAFASNRAGSYDIYSVWSDGSHLDQLTTDPADDLDPAWSPDGAHLAFARSRSAGAGLAYDLYLMDPDGGNPALLVSDDAANRDPAWAPDGTTLAYARNGAIWTVGANGSAPAALVTSAPASSSPAWSPDGSTLAFDAVASGRSDIYVVRADGSGLTKLSGGTSGAARPRWAPDGSRLTYAGTAGTKPTIATMLPDGSCPATLFTGPGGSTVEAPDWQPTTAGSLAISATPACATVQRGQTAIYDVSLARHGNVAPADLAVTGLPAGATAAIAPNPAWLSSARITISTSECPTATATGTHLLFVTATAGGTNRSTMLTLVVGDGPPHTVPPTSSLVTGTKGSTTTPVRTTWSACDHESIGGYAVDRKGKSWARVSTGAATSLTQNLTDGNSYAYRASASDATFGLGSAWAYAPTFQPKIIESSSTAVHTTGTWTTGSASSYSGGTTRFATAAGASATMTFIGSSVAWLAYKGPNRGTAKVYVDGVYKATRSLYASSYQARQIIYADNWGVQGRHTIALVVVGTAGHPRVDLDAFITLYAPAAYVDSTYNGLMTTEAPENITCVSASALTASNYAWGTVGPEYYSHSIAQAWYGQVRSSTQDFHDKYDYTGIEAGLDPRAWAWLLWAHAPPDRGYHDYWSSSQATVDSWMMSNIRNAAEPAGAIVFRSIHAVDVVGFSANIDPRNGAATLNGFYIVDPWSPNSTSTMADGGTIGLAPDTYLTLAAWNAMYFLPYVDKPYEAAHGPNLWHNDFVAVLRSADGTPEPTKTADAMPGLYQAPAGQAGSAATLGGTNAPLGDSADAAASTDPAAMLAATDLAATDSVHPESDVLGAVRDAVAIHGLDLDSRLGLERGAALTIGRRIDVASLSPDVPPYQLAEVRIAGRVVAIAMLIRTAGGIQFAGLEPLSQGNSIKDAASVRTTFVVAGVGVHGLEPAWRPSTDSFEPFSPYWVATDAHGARRYLTPAGKVVSALSVVADR